MAARSVLDERGLASRQAPARSARLRGGQFHRVATERGCSMLAPIITKDMNLFPAQKIPAHVKNVRSRAMSLDQFGPASQRSRVVPARTRNSASTGNLPSVASKSPPKNGRKPTLTAIQEGVEFSKPEPPPSTSRSASHLPNPSKETLERRAAKAAALQAARVQAKNSTSSEDSASSREEENKKKRKGVLGWFNAAFRRSFRERRDKQQQQGDAVSTTST